MRFRKKKNREAEAGKDRAGEGRFGRRALPVERYYTPNKSRSLSTERSKYSNESRKQLISMKSLEKALHWVGYGAVAVIFCANILLRGTVVKIQTPDRVPPYRSVEAYQEIVSEALSESLGNATKVTFRSEPFEQELQQRLPELQNATAVVPLVGTRLQVGLQFADPLVRLSVDQMTQGIVAHNGAYVLSDTSDAILSQYSHLPLFRLTPLASIEPGQAVLTESEVQLLSLVLDELDGSETYRPKVTGLEYNIEKREFRVDFSGVAYYAKLTSERDARTQVGALVASLQDLESQSRLPGQYIDVRAEGRVFVI